MKLVFTIPGNGKDPAGNAVPKLKMTGNQHWTPKAQAYKAWKTHVRAVMLNQIAGQGFLTRNEITKALYTDAKILDTTKTPMTMHLRIFWKNNAHGDPENIFGSIADAIFINDKNLNGSFTGEVCPEGRGRVEVTITTP